MAKTILLADDSVTIRKIVELTFGGSEIRVDAVGTGTEAIERFETAPPDLVVADVVMPDPSGYEICRVVKGSGHPVPVLLLAGAFEPYDEQLARECGADDYLVKPFESRTLIEKVNRLLDPPLPVDTPVDTPVEIAIDHTIDAEVDTEIDDLAGEVQESAVETPVPSEPEPADGGSLERFSPEQIEEVARMVVRHLSEDVVRDVVRDVVPELAARLIRERIRELEAEE